MILSSHRVGELIDEESICAENGVEAETLLEPDRN